MIRKKRSETRAQKERGAKTTTRDLEDYTNLPVSLIKSIVDKIIDLFSIWLSK